MLGKRPSSDDGTSDTSNNARSYPRKRVSIAVSCNDNIPQAWYILTDLLCEVCRLRKTRCDAAKPSCSFCAELDIKCVYKRPADSLRSETKPEELMQALKRLDRIERALDSITQQVGASNASNFQGSHSQQSPFPLIINPQPDIAPSPVSVTAQPNSRQYYACKPPSLLNFKHPLPDRSEWSWDCSERFFSDQMKQILDVRNLTNNASSNLDLSDMTLWKLQQHFEEHVLKWCPVCDSNVIMQHIQYARSIDFQDASAASCLSLLVFANGALAADSSLYSTSVKSIPGFGYYARAISILDKLSTASNDITILQCHLLAGAYLHHACRPLEAWRYVNQTAQDCILWLRSHSKNHSAEQEESFNRLYWICYVSESELEACLGLPSSGMREYSAEVPLPISRYEEEGMYYLLALVSLRKVMVEVLDTVGYSSRTGYVSYNPAVALELRTQIDEWYNHLPTSLKFSLAGGTVHNPRMAYLRLAYLTVVIIITWPFIISLAKPAFTTPEPTSRNPSQRPMGPTSHPSQDFIPTETRGQLYHHHRQSPTPSARGTPTSLETFPYPSNSPVIAHDPPPAHRLAAQTCIESCRAYLSYAEEILSQKSLVSHLLVRQYFAFTMILILCFNGVDEHNPSSIEEKNFLQKAMSNLKPWGIVPFVKICLTEMRRVGRARGLEGGL